MNDDFGFTVITEDELDDFFNEAPSLPPGMMSGTNIKTSCYGLFLIALEQAKSDDDLTLFKKALQASDDMHDDVAFNGLIPFFPPDELSYDNLRNLATVVTILNDTANGRVSNDISQEEIDRFEDQALELLGLRKGAIQIISDIPTDDIPTKFKEALNG